jgi:hypothetical protein
MRNTPRLSAPYVDGWRWGHVRDFNVPAWRKWVYRYSAENIPDDAADFLASATGWALHQKQTRVDRDATCLWGHAPKVWPLDVGSVLSGLAHCHANVAGDHVGHVHQRQIFSKDDIERAIHITRVGLQTISVCSLLSLDQENAFNTPPPEFPCGVVQESAIYHPVD